MAKVEIDRQTPRRRFRCPAKTEAAVLAACKLIKVPTGGGRADRPEGERAMHFGEFALLAIKEKLLPPMAPALVLRLAAQVVRASYEVPEGREEHEGNRLRDLGVELRKVADRLGELA